jgi:TonB-dependent receptor
LVFSAITAQTGTIRGTVIEAASGMTVIGANVTLKDDSSVGAVTDLDGEFAIQVAPGTYAIQVTYIGFQTLTVEDIAVVDGEVTPLGEIPLSEDNVTLNEVVVKASAIRKTETALLLLKKQAPAMVDGISSARMQLTGDATAVEAAKRVTGVSIEGGKYVYVRGLGDRYSKTTLNGVDIPGLDPDRNTLQMDIFPTNLLDNLVISKNFTADMPADFTGGLMNIETKDFPEEKIFSVSLSTSYNPAMHFNDNWLTYDGGNTDWLGYDDGTRALPAGADAESIPTPISGASDEQVNSFVRSFSPELAAQRQNSFIDYSAGISLGNQLDLSPDKKLGYIFSLSYKNSYKYYDDVIYGEYQRYSDPSQTELRYATIQNGELGEQNVLIGALGGIAFKTAKTKLRLTAMRLQNGENRAGKFDIDNDGEAVGQSGYIAQSDNLEYNERSLTNFLLSGRHLLGGDDSGWEVDWRLSPTFSTSDDPDIRRTAFTYTTSDIFFSAGAGGNPSRIWRSLSELNAVGKLDITKNYEFNGENARFKFGAGHVYKQRDYEILFFDIQFFGGQDWPNPDPAVVLSPEYIFPNRPNRIYYQSGNQTPNPNAYESNVNNTAFYVSNEFTPFNNLKAILGVRAENFIQRHTGRDQAYANGDVVNGNNLDNDTVLDNLDFFPTANLIWSLTDDQNLRASYTRTIARPSFKELSFAQIIDPITNRIFNGSLFEYGDWGGTLSETRINNFDLRWELYQEGGQLFSISTFYKQFDNPIELVRIPEQQTSTEFQPRNVGDGQLYGVELEVRKTLAFISPSLENLSISGNVTFVESIIDMTNTEFNARKNFEKTGENLADTRQMAGQAPFVINAGLAYANADKGWDAGLFYNVKGKTLEIVGGGLYPDIYFQPFHSLNFSLSKKLGADKKTAIDIQVSNILNDRTESLYQSFQARDQIFNSINPGTTIGLGISHKF